MPRCPPGGSEVMVARRPPSATARIAVAAPPGAALAAAATSAAPGDRADLFWPLPVVIVDHVARPEPGHPLPVGRACRRDDLSAAQRGQDDQQAAGDPAGPVDQDLLAGPDAERVAENLLGGERGHREGGGGLPAGARRLRGEEP